MRDFDRGKSVARRMEKGIGSDGVVIKTEGIDRASAAALNSALSILKVMEGTSCEAAGLPDDWKSTRGNIHSAAMPTDKADRSLKDCERLGRAFVDWIVPRSAAYSGTVDDVVNAKAMVGIPCHSTPREVKPAFGSNMPFPWANAVQPNHAVQHTTDNKVA